MVLVGSTEAATGSVAVKHMSTGEQQLVPLDQAVQHVLSLLAETAQPAQSWTARS